MVRVSYEVTTLDVCVQGFERLRSNSEFILNAYPDRTTTPAEVVEEFLRDIDSCSRPDDFDYSAARNAVNDYFATGGLGRLAAELNGVSWGEEPAPEDDDGNGIIAFLYVAELREE